MKKLAFLVASALIGFAGYVSTTTNNVIAKVTNNNTEQTQIKKSLDNQGLVLELASNTNDQSLSHYSHGSHGSHGSHSSHSSHRSHSSHYSSQG